MSKSIVDQLAEAFGFRGISSAATRQKAFDELSHPRHPEGDKRGGQFAPKGGASASGASGGAKPAAGAGQGLSADSSNWGDSTLKKVLTDKKITPKVVDEKIAEHLRNWAADGGLVGDSKTNAQWVANFRKVREYAAQNNGWPRPRSDKDDLRRALQMAEEGEAHERKLLENPSSRPEDQESVRITRDLLASYNRAARKLRKMAG